MVLCLPRLKKNIPRVHMIPNGLEFNFEAMLSHCIGFNFHCALIWNHVVKGYFISPLETRQP